MSLSSSKAYLQTICPSCIQPQRYSEANPTSPKPPKSPLKLLQTQHNLQFFLQAPSQTWPSPIQPVALVYNLQNLRGQPLPLQNLLSSFSRHLPTCSKISKPQQNQLSPLQTSLPLLYTYLQRPQRTTPTSPKPPESPPSFSTLPSPLPPLLQPPLPPPLPPPKPRQTVEQLLGFDGYTSSHRSYTTTT